MTLLKRLITGASRRRLGLRMIGTHVEPRTESFLKAIFAKLAGVGELGEYYRLAVATWPLRRRPLLLQYFGMSDTLEIDGPQVGRHLSPIGGRVISSNRKAWIELTPEQAVEVRDRVKHAVDSALNQWIDDHHLSGQHIDTTGVAREIQHEPWAKHWKDDDEFALNEARIAKDVVEKEQQRHAVLNDPSVYYFTGPYGAPSRCRVIEADVNGVFTVCLSNILPLSGTSTTNVIEDLVTQLYHDRFNAHAAEDISWYEHYPAPSGSEASLKFLEAVEAQLSRERKYAGAVEEKPWYDPNARTHLHESLTRVTLRWNAKHMKYDDANWSDAGEIPGELRAAIDAVLSHAPATEDNILARHSRAEPAHG